VAVSSLAAAPAGGVPAPAASTARASRAEAAFPRPAAAPVATLPAASAATPAAAADETVDGDLRVTVQEALNPEGCGWVLLPIDVSEDLLGAVCNGAQGPAAEAAQPIINSQLHARMLELGDAADRGRRQVAVASEGGGFEDAVHNMLGAVASRVSNDLHAGYDGVTPHVVITMPRAPAQLPHTDAGLHTQQGSTPTLLSVYVSVEEGTGVEVFSNVYGGAGEDGECTTLPTPVWVDIPVGSCLVVRSDLVHRGTSNLRGRRQLRCLHAYLAVACNGTHMAYAEYMSFLSCYF